MNIYFKLLIIAGWISITLLSSIFSKRFLPNKVELSRKIVHIGTGPIILFAWWFELSKIVTVIAAGLITLGLIINYQLRLVPSIEDISRKSYGTIAYGTSITILMLLFWPKYASGISLGILSMAFGDGFAGLLGPSINSPTWRILGQKKSLVGTCTVLIIVAIITIIISSLSGSDLRPIQILFLSLIATVLEQFSPWGIDNITVPLGVTYTWILMTSN